MPNCLDRGLEGVEWCIVDSTVANTDFEPSDAVVFGDVDSLVEAIELTLGADYISCPAAYLLQALARKQVKDLVVALDVEQLFTTVAFNTELVARVKSLILAPAHFKA